MILIFGSASSFLGFLVMFAWHANLPILIQTQSTFVPMQYNTALGFLFSGLGLILVKFSRVGLGKFVGILVSLLGGLTLIQYFFDIDFGIDQLVIESFIQIQTSHPGRMAPNTALSFFLFGVYLLCWNNRNKSSIVTFQVLQEFPIN
ncbi:MAG: hypothetical protein IID17_06160 [Nitrospinae bacterium]|nr:hypothetical protein [Nitrospinota bacterium]